MRVLALALLLLPVVAAQTAEAEGAASPAPTSLYFHLDEGRGFPMNTVEPGGTSAGGSTLAAHTTGCLPAGPGVPTRTWHRWFGYPLAGRVESDSQARVNHERGIASDVHLDARAEHTLHWYLQTRAAGRDAVLPVPEVTVTATVRAGDAVYGIHMDDQYNEGEVLARGSSGPSLLAGDASRGPARHLGDGLYHFAVPLVLLDDRLPQAGFHFQVDVFLEEPTGTCRPEEGTLMLDAVGIHGGPDARPRLDLVVLDPVRIEYIHPRFVGDDLVVHIAASSPWGTYDVGRVEVRVEGPEGVVLERTVPCTRECPGPIVVPDLRPGTYVVTVHVFNLQETASGSVVVVVEVPLESRAASGLGVSPLGALLVLWARRSASRARVCGPTGPP